MILSHFNEYDLISSSLEESKSKREDEIKLDLEVAEDPKESESFRIKRLVTKLASKIPSKTIAPTKKISKILGLESSSRKKPRR